jgi:hypothetical protein
MVPALTVLIAGIGDWQIWYAFPLIVAISFVYGATRHEYWPEILINSVRTAVWILVFMAIIFGIITFVSNGL